MEKKARAYNWAEIPTETVGRGYSRKGFVAQNSMLVMNECRSGMDMSPHSHTFEQVVYIVQGQAYFHVGEERLRVGPGSVFAIPAGVTHCIEPIGDEPVLDLDVFVPPRQDYMHLVAYQQEV